MPFILQGKCKTHLLLYLYLAMKIKEFFINIYYLTLKMSCVYYIYDTVKNSSLFFILVTYTNESIIIQENIFL